MAHGSREMGTGKGKQGKGKGKGKGWGTEDPVALSKALTRVLRHEAVKLRLEISADGFVALSPLLTSDSVLRRFSEQAVRGVVRDCKKSAFCFRSCFVNRTVLLARRAGRCGVCLCKVRSGEAALHDR